MSDEVKQEGGEKKEGGRRSQVDEGEKEPKQSGGRVGTGQASRSDGRQLESQPSQPNY